MAISEKEALYVYFYKGRDVVESLKAVNEKNSQIVSNTYYKGGGTKKIFLEKFLYIGLLLCCVNMRWKNYRRETLVTI